MSQLWCAAVSGDDVTRNEIVRLSLQPEEGKKSAFLFDPELPLTIPKPAHLIVEFSKCDHGNEPESSQIFFLGGFQAVTNAKHLEVYLTDKNGKEEYLMTSKGIPFQKGENGEEWQKAVCVVPGGPRSILGIHVKLLSLRPLTESNAQIKSIKITARIPDTLVPSSKANLQIPSQQEQAHRVETMNQSTLLGNAPISMTSTNASFGQSSSITQADLGAAMASLSIMARSTEDGIEKVLIEKCDRLETIFHTRLSTVEQHMTSLTMVTASQKSTIDGQTKLLELQYSMMNAQSEQMKSLLEQQQSMSEMVEDLQVQLSALRKEVKDNATTPTTKEHPALSTAPPEMEEEPMEGGIEHTLSNLELGDNEDEEQESETSETFVMTERTIPQCGTAVSPRLKPVADSIPTLLEDSEKIEVSLMEGTDEAMLGHVHEESGQISPRQAPYIGAPEKVPSFEDRNDKNEAKEAEADTPCNVELEVMTGHDDETVEVVESTTADEHERSPPDVAINNLVDL